MTINTIYVALCLAITTGLLGYIGWAFFETVVRPLFNHNETRDK